MINGRRVNKLLPVVATAGAVLLVLNNLMAPIQPATLMTEDAATDEVERGDWPTSPNMSSNLKRKLSTLKLCTQRQRLSHIKSICATARHKSHATAARSPRAMLLVDDRHRLTYCAVSKTSSTSLKAVILEENGLRLRSPADVRDPFYFVHGRAIANKYGLHAMTQLSAERRDHVLRNYRHLMSVRHPLDRLLAYYRDKILGDDRSANHRARAAAILRESRPELAAAGSGPPSARRKWPQDAVGPPTFAEFAEWLHRHRATDVHWGAIGDACRPCAHDWHGVLRTETLAADGAVLLRALNSSRTHVPVMHSHQVALNAMRFGETLGQYADVSREAMRYLLELYRRDMDMFGYGWDADSNTAYCYIPTEDGGCC